MRDKLVFRVNSIFEAGHSLKINAIVVILTGCRGAKGRPVISVCSQERVARAYAVTLFEASFSYRFDLLRFLHKFGFPVGRIAWVNPTGNVKETLIKSGNAVLAANLTPCFVAKPRRTYGFACVLLRAGRQIVSPNRRPSINQCFPRRPVRRRPKKGRRVCPARRKNAGTRDTSVLRHLNLSVISEDFCRYARRRVPLIPRRYQRVRPTKRIGEKTVDYQRFR